MWKSKQQNESVYEVTIRQMQGQLAQQRQAFTSLQGKYKKATGALEEIAARICDTEYAASQLGGVGEHSSMNNDELKQFIIRNVQEQFRMFASQIQDLHQQLSAEQSAHADLSRKYIALQKEMNEMSMSGGYEPQTLSNTPKEPLSPNTPSMENSSGMGGGVVSGGRSSMQAMPTVNAQGGSSNVLRPRSASQGQVTERSGQGSGIRQTRKPVGGKSGFGSGKVKQAPQSVQAVGEKTEEAGRSWVNPGLGVVVEEGAGSGKDDVVYVDDQPILVSDALEKMDEYQWGFLEVLGTTGLNEQVAIVEELSGRGVFGAESNIRRNLKAMIQNKILEQETLSTPIRSKITLLSLSKLGCRLFKERYGKDPVKDEKTRIKEMHATLPHGYCIKDTANTLETLGYQDVCMDSTKNVFQVADGRRYMPDITARFDGRMTYWEVELGHHHDQDMADKLSKAALVAKTVYIVVDKMETKQKLKNQVNFFKKQAIRNKIPLDMTIYVGTMTELRDRTLLTINENKMDLHFKKN